jgi:Protein of unknown function (DUF2854)
LVLRFHSPLISWETWQDKQEKMGRFFGPGIIAIVSKPEIGNPGTLAKEQEELHAIDLRLIAEINN